MKGRPKVTFLGQSQREKRPEPRKTADWRDLEVFSNLTVSPVGSQVTPHIWKWKKEEEGRKGGGEWQSVVDSAKRGKG